MKKTVCDFCGKDVDIGGVRFRYRGKLYRIYISVYGIGHGNGFRANRIDACPGCTVKYSIKASKGKAHELKRKIQTGRDRSDQGSVECRHQSSSR